MNSDTYDARMKLVAAALQHDPVLLALHESSTNPHDGRNWYDILYPRTPQQQQNLQQPPQQPETNLIVENK